MQKLHYTFKYEIGIYFNSFSKIRTNYNDKLNSVFGQEHDIRRTSSWDFVCHVLWGGIELEEWFLTGRPANHNAGNLISHETHLGSAWEWIGEKVQRWTRQGRSSSKC